MANNANKYYIEKPITGKDLSMLINSRKPFVFRGQSCHDWGLKSTFERACGSDKIHKLGWKELEDKIRFEFKRQAYHYITKLPDSDFEWLALMQHYGSPTRLLDFTKSIWAALFFAVDGATDDSALWAIDASYFKSNHDPTKPRNAIISDYNEDLVTEIEKYLTDDSCPECGEEHADEWSVHEDRLKNNDPEGYDVGIIFSEPFYKNQRLAIQQGLFAFPQELYFNFEINMSRQVDGISKSFKDLSDKEGECVIYKFKIPSDKHLRVIAFLSQMNITAATLYPGLEGFARSQINHVRLQENDNENIAKAIKGKANNGLIKLAIDEIFDDGK